MESLGDALMAILKEHKPNLLENIGEFDNEKYLQRKADWENEQEGNLKGIDCRKCKNKGHISIVKDGELMWQMCECNKARKSLLLIEQSGLKPLLDEYTFEKYDAIEPWQKNALSMAQNFVEYGEGNWLFFGGQSGAGKTMLCTAICGELLKRNNAVKYMMWDSESKALKSLVNDTYEYQRRMDELKSVKVLYIDDFLKVQRGQQPTPADINLAFEIINHRDVKNLRTIISTERTIDDIISLDEALGGRINRRSRGYQMNIAYDKNKNFRLRK
jgi:DNA replication protein DnaC